MKTFPTVLILGAACLAAPPLTEIAIHAERVFPESVTSTADGSLIVGNVGKHMIFRSKPGAATVEPWIEPGANGLQDVLGVLADDRANTLWVCSTNMSGKGEGTALKSFELKTGKAKASYPFPGEKSVCNDIAVASDGAAYVTDTANPRILRLKPGASTLEVWTTDDRFDSLDGIAFGDKSTIYVNTVRTGHLFRIPLQPDGSAGKATQLTLSATLAGPDGMRAVGNNRLLVAENRGGRVDRITFEGDNAKIEVLKEGINGPTAVTKVGNTAWILEAKPSFMSDPKLKDQDPGPFKLYSVSLRAK
jgi:sugar lactone lactonase YvrE